MSNRKVINPSTIKGYCKRPNIFPMVCNLILKVSSRKLAMEIVIKMVKYYQLLPVGVLKLLVNVLESCLLYTAILYIKLLGLYNNFAKT